MTNKIYSITLALAVFFAVVLSAAGFVGCKETVPGNSVVGWNEQFDPAGGRVGSIPEGWVVKGKPGTKKADFSVQEDKGEGISYLHMEADDASASLLTQVKDVALLETPVLKWRWRATVLPAGADGRDKAKDDQAIGLYVGAEKGARKAVSYRWDTETPVGSEGECAYGLGTIKIKWFTLRNKSDIAGGKWFEEERNFMEDFKEAWGYYPDQIYISVSCNSQYTGTEAAADLAWLELVSPQEKGSSAGKPGDK